METIEQTGERMQREWQDSQDAMAALLSILQDEPGPWRFADLHRTVQERAPTLGEWTIHAALHYALASQEMHYILWDGPDDGKLLAGPYPDPTTS